MGLRMFGVLMRGGLPQRAQRAQRMVGAVAMGLRTFDLLMRGGWTEWTKWTEWTVVQGADSIIVAIGSSGTTPSNSREALWC